LSSVLPVLARLCTDASVGPKVAAAGIVFRLYSSLGTPEPFLDTTVFSAESLPMGLTIPESEALALKRGYTLLRQIFNSHPLKLQLVSLHIVTDNRTVADLFIKKIRSRSALLHTIRDEIIKDFVGPSLSVEHVTMGNARHPHVSMLKEAHTLARSYKRNLGALLHD
jgi:hypothetical protein